jgi:capsular polysaccharide biosynthesis protein
MHVLAAALLRRWLLVVSLLLLAGAVSFATTRAVPPDYEAKSTVLLVPPEAQNDPGGNRYLTLGGLTPARDIVIQSLNSDSLRSKLTKGTDNTYEVSQDFTSSTPFVVITATGPTPTAADDLLTRLVAEVPRILTSLQDAISTGESVRITSVEVSHDEPKRAGKKQVRAVIAATGGCVVVGVLLIGLLDRRLLRRAELKTRTSPRRAAEPEPAGAPDTTPERPQAGSEPEAELEPAPEAESESEFESDAEPETEPETEAEAEAKIGSEPEVDAGSEPAPGTGRSPATARKTETDPAARRDDRPTRATTPHAPPVQVKRRTQRPARAGNRGR